MNIKENIIYTHNEIFGNLKLKKGIKSIWGVAPVAPMHLGYDSLVLLQKRVANLGIEEHLIVLSDLHALMTHSLSKSELKKRSVYYEFFFKEIYEIKNAKVILGSDFQKENDYVEFLFSLLRVIPLSKVKNTLPSLRKNQPLMSFITVYPIMQCLDVLHNKRNLVIGELGQKKIYDLLKIISSKYTLKDDKLCNNLDIIYIRQSHDILGKPLNLSSSKTRISFHEDDDSLGEKIKKMYAPPSNKIDSGRVNALLETFEFSVFPWFNSVDILLRDGSTKKYSNYKEFEKDYFIEILHPNAAKKELHQKLLYRIQEAQEKLKGGITNWINPNKLN